MPSHSRITSPVFAGHCYVMLRSVTAIAISILLHYTALAETRRLQGDVMVYGATPAGIAASLSAAQDGCTVYLVEPTRRIGGLLTNGLSHSDFHSRESLSGVFLDFTRRVEAHYVRTYGSQSQQVKQCEWGVFGEPKVNLMVLDSLLKEHPSIRVLQEVRLQSVQLQPSQTAVTGETNHIQSVMCENLEGEKIEFTCAIVIDASYEGDLMARAGVPWRSGREARGEYGEPLAPEKSDNQLQAYNFRFVMTTTPENRVTPLAPEGYRREDFVEVLEVLRSEKVAKVFGYPSNCIFKAHLPALPNNKYDINDVSRNLIRLSLPGKNLQWPDGSREDRRAIFMEHLRDQAGLLYFLQTDREVPEKYQQEARQWGWCRDEFEDSHHVPDQLYVREARRMVGQYVYSQKDSEHAAKDARAVWHPDSIAMGDYGNNCHGTFHEGPRFGGKHTGEFYNPVPPYQIPYGVLVPKNVDNLLVPTATSSTHVGFCALRLEPIWMSLGQASGHAAAWARRHECSVQKVAVRAVQSRLHEMNSATIYVSDVLPGQDDFAMVQWWGNQGGLHGLEPMPDQTGKRGRQLHGQYYAANPGHEAALDRLLDPATAKRWKALCVLAGFAPEEIPKVSESTTRGDFLRTAFALANSQGLTRSTSRIPGRNPKALVNTHAPGEVDDLELARFVITDPSILPGIVVDDTDAELVGEWTYSTHTPPYVGRGYLHDNYLDKGAKSVRFTPTIPRAGLYEVRMAHCTNIRRTTAAPVSIHHADGKTSIVVNQQAEPENARLFKSLGVFRFELGRSGFVEISTQGTEGKVVIADAMQFLPVP